MEFTTRFGLHSQANPTPGRPGPARRGPLPASHRPRAAGSLAPGLSERCFRGAVTFGVRVDPPPPNHTG